MVNICIKMFTFILYIPKNYKKMINLSKKGRVKLLLLL